MRLIYTSNPLSLVITNYEPMSFEYDGWTVSEEYDYVEKYPNFHFRVFVHFYGAFSRSVYCFCNSYWCS